MKTMSITVGITIASKLKFESEATIKVSNTRNTYTTMTIDTKVKLHITR